MTVTRMTPFFCIAIAIIGSVSGTDVDSDWRSKVPSAYRPGLASLDLNGHDYQSQSRLLPKIISRMDKASGVPTVVVDSQSTASTPHAIQELTTVQPQPSPRLPTAHVIPVRLGSTAPTKLEPVRLSLPAENAPVRFNKPAVPPSQFRAPDNQEPNPAGIQTAAVAPVTYQQPTTQQVGINTFQQRPAEGYVYDLLAPPVTSGAVANLFHTAIPGQTYPDLVEIPAQSRLYKCTTHQAKSGGYYADTATRCQVFQRCGEDGVATQYLCPNQTVFNQVTLTCDWWFNVDCPSSSKYVNFANSRLNSNLPLFDSPPEDYVPNWTAVYYAKLAADQGYGPELNQHNIQPTSNAKFALV